VNRSEILDTAKKCVCGNREEDYGSPESNFSVIAGLMCLVKIARVASGRVKMDNFVDLAGYAACGGEIAQSDAKAEPILTAKWTLFRSELGDSFMCSCCGYLANLRDTRCPRCDAQMEMPDKMKIAGGSEPQVKYSENHFGTIENGEMKDYKTIQEIAGGKGE
jgi:hypothetical protein